jgi:signal transduction histidine kinase/CheY-like chemotaxis protein
MLMIVLLIAFAVSSTLQRIISEPVAELARTAREVSEKADFSLRAKKSTSDELDVLVDAVNDMLERIQQAQNERIDLLHREREANRLKDEFLMTLSHELRTPLNAILGWTRMLTSRVTPPEATQRALERIERNAIAQTRLVEDLLEVSRFTTGKFRLETQPIDLVTLTNNAVEAIRPDAEARRLTIETHVSDAALPSVGDPERLQQVIWNLLSNAVKFSTAGGRILVSLRRDGAWDEVVVSDSGVGIAPAFLPNVFDPFRQADSSSTRAHGGLGLGLSIVRRIAEMHGGRVSAASAGPGLGATFTVRLPVVAVQKVEPRQTPAAPRPAVARDGSLAGLEILIVDDDEDSRDLLVSLLDGAGASVQAASSSAEALQLSARRAPEVLLTDIAMPGQDGYVLMVRLKDLLGAAMPRVTIALTAQAGEHDRRRALAAGFTRHVAKPFDPVALVELLRTLVAESAA